MARRKEFKTIADGLLSSFISRNNDVYGYWGIGKLYSHMLKSKSMILEIDLIRRTIEPIDKEFELLINSYSDKLLAKMRNREIDSNHLNSAKIILTGYPNEPILYHGQDAPNRMNCEFKITDDLGKQHFITKDVWCRKHSRRKESKSARKY